MPNRNNGGENENDKRVILSIGKKEFGLGGLGGPEHDETFRTGWRRWTEYDHETASVQDRLAEFPLNFPPTYPFEENVEEGASYMKTRQVGISNVTRLGDFWDSSWQQNLLAKEAQMNGKILGYFEKPHAYVKLELATFWPTFGKIGLLFTSTYGHTGYKPRQPFC